jgi:branched-chain amino acid transport system substrate-binding protein
MGKGKRGTLRRNFLRTAGTVTLAGVAGCLGGNGGSSGNNQTITLGASISETGSLAHEGNLYLDSYKMTIHDINKQGGIEIGGKEYELALTYYDDESSASTARQLYQRLIERDGINYLLGPYSSGVTLAAQPIVQRNQLPMVEGGGASSEIFTKDNEYVFGILATANNYADGALALADTFKDPPVTKLALAVENETFSQDAARGVRNLAKKYGWEVVVDQTFPTGSDDLTAIINAVSNAQPQVFVVSGHYQHAVLAANQLKQYGVNVPMTVATVGVTPQSFIKTTGEAGNYFYGTSQWAANADYNGFFYGSGPEYTKAFTEVYDYKPDYHNTAGSACILTYLNAFKKVDSLSPESVHAALKKTDITTCMGDVNFGENLSNTGIVPVAYQWQNRSKALVGPPNIATEKAVYPTPPYSERKA